MLLKQKWKRFVKGIAEKWKRDPFFSFWGGKSLRDQNRFWWKSSWNLAQTSTFTYILLDGIFSTPGRISLLRVLLQRCTFLDHFGALLAPFPALRTEDRNSQPAPAPRRKFSSRVRAAAPPHSNKMEFQWNAKIFFTVSATFLRFRPRAARMRQAL